MKKYNVHVILKDKFHSVVIECDGFVAEKGYYGFYKGKEAMHQIFSYYPIVNTIIEPFNTNIPTGSGQYRNQ